MRVGDKHIRGDTGQRLQMRLSRIERRQGGEVVHVADVLAQPGVLSVGDRHGVLQVCSHGQCRRHRDRQRDGQRRVSARAPDRQLDAVDHPHDRVIAGHQDGPVVHQPAVGEVRKPVEGIVIGEADRLATQIARRHHQRRRSRLIARQPEQQDVQRRVGQHDAEIGVMRRHRIGDRGAGTPWHEHDRALRPGQHPRG